MSTTALPSFVELMASLGLENNTSSLHPETASRHSRSSSYSSTCSVLSQSSSSALSQSSTHTLPQPDLRGSPSIIISSPVMNRDPELDRHRYRARFSPYTPAISHVRRGSLPSIVKEEELDGHTISGSPRTLSPQRTVGRRSSALGLSHRRPEKLTLDADLIANTPISSFLRRKTPQSSPISPTFPHRTKRSNSPSVPVSIPTLPSFCFPAQVQPTPVSLDCQSSDTDDDLMSDSSSIRRERPRRRRKHLATKYRRHRPRYSESSISSLQPHDEVTLKSNQLLSLA